MYIIISDIVFVDVLRAIDKAGCDMLTRRRVREKGQLPGALWHIYMARDADKIRDLLNKVKSLAFFQLLSCMAIKRVEMNFTILFPPFRLPSKGAPGWNHTMIPSMTRAGTSTTP